MKPIFTILLLITSTQCFSQDKTSWISDSLRNKGLNSKFEFSPYISPSYLQTDLNGDGFPDFAILISEKRTGKEAFFFSRVIPLNTTYSAQELNLVTAPTTSNGRINGRSLPVRKHIKHNLVREAT